MVCLDQNLLDSSVEVDGAPGTRFKTEVEPRVYRQAAEWERGERKCQGDPRSVDLGTEEEGVI